ncbi:L-serine ammonia-lyase [Brooklawnia cerclae]
MPMAARVGVTTLFQVGIGPSSSHTVGPMRAAASFAELIGQGLAAGAPDRSAGDLGLRVDVYGSLAATGRGHGTFGAILLGLEGYRPDAVSASEVSAELRRIEDEGLLRVRVGDGVRLVPMRQRDLVCHPLTLLPYHPNGLHFAAECAGRIVADRYYFSVGGGFVREFATPEGEDDRTDTDEGEDSFSSSSELLALCHERECPVSETMLAEELRYCGREAIYAHLDAVAQVMLDCIDAGFHSRGLLPGALKVRRRAGDLYDDLRRHDSTGAEAMTRLTAQASDWVTAAAMAVNEQNAAGERIVTAPTNGAAGIVPAVLYYALRFAPGLDRAESDTRREGIRRYLLAAAAVGSLCKRRASISGAEVGCQGEVGTAAAMAAAGLAELLGGTPGQVENAAEIAIEHHLGLTCDPVAGLVQIPCIERNGIGANTAIVAARTAVWGNGSHRVSLDEAVETMRQTGLDMSTRYKETALGGLAVNVADC